MADAGGKIQYDFTGNTTDLESAVGRVGAALDKSAGKVVAATSKTSAGLQKHEKAAKKAAVSTKNLGDKFDVLVASGGNLNVSMLNLLGPAGKLTAGMLGMAAAIFKVADAHSQWVDEQVLLADTLGLTTKDTIALDAALKASGLSLQQAQTGMASFTAKLKDAALKGGEAEKSFARLGVRAANVDGTVRDANTVFRETIDALSDVKDPSQRAALAVDLFGARGAKLAAALKDGTATLDRWNETAREYGVIIDGEALGASAAMDEAMVRLELSTRGASNAFAEQFTPDVVDTVDRITTAINMAGQFADVLDRVNTVAGYATGMTILRNAIKALGDQFGETADDIQGAQDKSRDALAVYRAAAEHGLALQMQAEQDAVERNTRGRKKAAKESAKVELTEQQKLRAELMKEEERLRDERKTLRENAIQSDVAARQEAAERAVAAQEEAVEAFRAAKEAEVEINAEAAMQMAEANAAVWDGSQIALEGMLDATNEALGAWISSKADTIEKLRNKLEDGEETLTKAQKKAIRARIKEEQEAANRIFIGDKVAKLGQIAMATALAIMQAYAQLGPIGGSFAAIGIGALGAVQAGIVAGEEPPKYHTGGIVRDPSEVPITARRGEGVLTEQGVASIGGAAGVAAANAGMGGGGPRVTQFVLNHKVIDTMIDHSLGHDGPLRRATSSSRALGRRNPYRAA